MTTPLNQLPPERDRSGTRYKLTLGSQPILIDTKNNNKPVAINSPLAETPEIQSMLAALVVVANRRVDTFDPLLNSYEAFGCILDLLKENFVELFEAGLMQPIIDLFVCVHELVAGARPGIVFHRPRDFDGGYRWLETIEEQESEGKNPRKASKNAIRLNKDIHEARIVLAYRALLKGFGSQNSRSKEDAKPAMQKLLKDNHIRNVNDEPDRPIKVADVERLHRYVEEQDQRSLGRTASVEKLQQLRKKEFEACTDPVSAKKFAEKILIEASWRQPTNWPPTALE